jgi:hypothetical protein
MRVLRRLHFRVPGKCPDLPPAHRDVAVNSDRTITPRWEAAIDVRIEWRLMPVRKPCGDTREFLSSEPPPLGW